MEVLVALLDADEVLDQRHRLGRLGRGDVQGCGNGVAVRDDRDVVGGAERTDVQLLGDPSGPILVGLETPTAPLPVIVKGILTPEDAHLAVDAGADGSSFRTMAVASSTARRRRSRYFRRSSRSWRAGSRCSWTAVFGVGGDVLKAIALGAVAVLIGRPTAWGLAVDGDEGVFRVLEIFREELDTAFALSGCRTVSDITSELVRRAPRG